MARRNPLRFMVGGLFLASFLLAPLAGPATAARAASPPTGDVHVVQVDGNIDRILGRFLVERIEAAPAEGAQLVLLTIDSGASYGFDAERLIAAIKASPVPLAVWVGGQGAVARGVAQQVAANADFVAVAPDARIEPPVKVDLVAPAVGDVVVALDGVDLRGRHLATAQEVPGPNGITQRQPSVPVRFFKPSFPARVLHAVASPNIALFLLIAGLIAIAFEFYTAGIGLAGLTGAFCLVLSFFGLTALPVHWWGAVVIGVGMAACMVDAQNLRLGGFTIAGTVLVGVGMLGAFLGAPEGFRLSLWVSALTLGLTVFFWTVALPVMVRTRYATPLVRRDGMVGETGTTTTPMSPRGVVRVRGAEWEATGPPDSSLAQGERIEVRRVDGITLVVARAEGDT